MTKTNNIANSKKYCTTFSVKEKLEEQAKAEYSIEMMKLRQEEEKLDKLKLRRDMYQSKLYDAVTDKLNILEIKILEDSVENIKYNIKLQMVVVANQQRAVEKAGEKLDNAMKERKTYEKLKENIIEGRVLNSIGKKICNIIL